ncbi:redoxin domain-containing protein [Flectobacillus longus]|uniref:redoxin domain-containing protein n=1 Tax=Flectobacillus longus TaxID=2984207 RepID=UPI0024B799DC|nr:redoxin domain-containing protein [Flectobacillus longus]MDI9880628.1 redoxin domain-containing protein [Flectobacillus longus]
MIYFIKTRKTQLNKLLSSILGAGKQFPTLSFAKENGEWNIDFPEDQQQLSLEEIAQGKPILITYYIPEWKEYADQQLWLLQKSVRRLSELGVQILTITNLTCAKIKELKQNKKLTFSIYCDDNQQIAKSIGLLSEHTPCTQMYAGISENIPLPASFLVLANGLIIHHFIDIELQSYLSYKEIEVFVNNYKNSKKNL